MSVVYRLGRASVSQVREQLEDAPSYSAVRTMLGQLESKGHLRRDRSDITHVYLPARSTRAAGLTAFRRLIDTFFSDSTCDGLAMLIEDSAKQLSEEEIRRLEQAIQNAKSQNAMNKGRDDDKLPD